MLKKRFRNFASIVLVVILMVFLAGCGNKEERSGNKTELRTRTDLVLATTTSTQDSGLLDELIPVFEKSNPYRVKTIAVGSGEALAMGQRGEADVLLVHSPKSEKEFMAGGYGKSRKPVMYNWFLLLGPRDDTAKVRGAATAEEALKAISGNQATFISRGDESGTHKKELSLWEKAGISPSGSWYLQSGQGMGETLRIADQKGAYTLTDEATFLTVKSSVSLTEIALKDDDLKNPYSVITVAAKGKVKLNQDGARALANFLTRRRGRSIIRKFGREKYSKPLFYLKEKD